MEKDQEQKNYHMGTRIDTTFEYYENGQVASIYLDDGKGGYSKSKCFKANGSPCSCEDLALDLCLE